MTQRILFASIAITALAGCTDAGGVGQQDDFISETPSMVFTAEDGWLDIEDDYLPRVCTQENGNAAYQALEAQAIAARTYLLRAMRDDDELGTEAKPVVNGESFQAYAATSNPGCAQAAEATRGVVARYQGELIVANYVAGALVRADGTIGKDPTHTEIFVTYNEGKSGSDVTPAPKPIALPSRPDNRGCMGQNRADYLAKTGSFADGILAYFYGTDMVLTGGEGINSGDPCGSLPSHGACYGDTLFWCAEGAVESFDCSLTGRQCQASAETGPSCIDPVEPVQECGDVTYEGTCEGDVLSYCSDYGVLEVRDCAEQGLTCAPHPGYAGNECLPALEEDCSEGGGPAKCYGTFLVRCSGDAPAYIDCASLGMACGYYEDRVDCFQVVSQEPEPAPPGEP
ncbi:MAG: SpoIID/LytB domain-containing protein [Polyangiaceae bacterium]